MELMGKKVLVTGAGGFIGSHLVQRLVQQGCEVRAMVHYNSAGSWGNLELLPSAARESIEVFPADITDPFSVQRAVQGCGAVFHLAALIAIPYSYLAPQSYVSTNVGGTLNVMEACRREGVEKVVHTSTSETYGSARYTPIDEQHPLQGQSPYSASKIGADKIVESYYCSFGLPVATIRPFNTYGPRQSARAVIPAIISQILSGSKELRLGALTPVRDFNYVKDTVEGFVSVASSDRCVGELVNIGFGKGITIGDLAKTIVEIMGGGVTIVSGEERIRPEKSEVMELLCANGRARELAGWEPSYTLKQGLLETIAFIEENLSLFKPELYRV